MTIAIRKARVEDAGRIAKIYAPIVRDTAISFETEPPSAVAMGERIASTLLTHPYLVAERDGKIVGYAYAGKHRGRAAYRWSVDVSVYVHSDAYRSGVGRALYKPLLRILAGTLSVGGACC